MNLFLNLNYLIKSIFNEKTKYDFIKYLPILKSFNDFQTQRTVNENIYIYITQFI